MDNPDKYFTLEEQIFLLKFVSGHYKEGGAGRVSSKLFEEVQGVISVESAADAEAICSSVDRMKLSISIIEAKKDELTLSERHEGERIRRSLDTISIFVNKHYGKALYAIEKAFKQHNEARLLEKGVR